MCYFVRRALCKHARHSVDPRQDRRGSRRPFERVMSPSQGSRWILLLWFLLALQLKGLRHAALKGVSLPHEREERSALKEGVPGLFLAVFPRPWKRPVLLKEEVTGREDNQRQVPFQRNRFLPFPGQGGSHLPFPDLRKGSGTVVLRGAEVNEVTAHLPGLSSLWDHVKQPVPNTLAGPQQTVGPGVPIPWAARGTRSAPSLATLPLRTCTCFFCL